MRSDQEIQTELDEEEAREQAQWPLYQPAIWSGYYDKVFYWVHLPSGERVECWPNAGLMNATDGSGRMWKPEDQIIVSKQRPEEARFAETQEPPGVITFRSDPSVTAQLVRAQMFVTPPEPPQVFDDLPLFKPWEPKYKEVRGTIGYKAQAYNGGSLADHRKKVKAKAKRARYLEKKRRRRGG